MAILVLVEDLIFLSKIRETAKLLNIELSVIPPAKLEESLASGAVSVVICDLNFPGGRALEAVRAMKRDEVLRSVPVLAFVSHVQAELATAAREAGCDVVMARSAFSLRLPEILRDYSPGPPRHAQ